MLLLLALVWGQTLAPLAALRVAAAPAGTFVAPICGHEAGAEATASDEAVPAQAGCRACPLCAAGLAVPVVPTVAPAMRPLRWTIVTYPIPPPAEPAPRPGTAGRPRAPPTSL